MIPPINNLEEEKNEEEILEKVQLLEGSKNKIIDSNNLRAKTEFFDLNKQIFEENNDQKNKKTVNFVTKKKIISPKKNVAHFDKLIKDFDLNSIYEDDDFNLIM